MPKEAVLWGTWLLSHAAEYDRYDYDVRVGPGRPAPAGLPQPVIDSWVLQSMRRIDVVGWRAGAPTLFSVNPHGGRLIYGELKLYERLFRTGPRWVDGVLDRIPYLGAVKLAAVVGAIAPDLLQTMTDDSIRVDVISGLAL